MNKAFYHEGHVEDWFKENYFILGFDFIMPYWPGDFLAIKDNIPIIIELELVSSGMWLHKWHIRKYFDYLICYHMNDIDKIRLEGAKMKYFAIDEYLQKSPEEERKEKQQYWMNMFGIEDLPK